MTSLLKMIPCILLSCMLTTAVQAAPKQKNTVPNANASSPSITLNKIIAVVNGEMVTQHELVSRLALEQGRNTRAFAGKTDHEAKTLILDGIINDMLLRQEGVRLKLTVSDADVENELRRFVQRSKLSQNDFESKLVSQGSSTALLREQLKNNILRQRIYSVMVTRKIHVSDGEIATYYEKNKQQFITEPTVEFSILSLPESTNPQKIRKQLESKAITFEDAALKYSTDANASNGGKVGPILQERLSPPLLGLLKKLKPGQISPLIQIGPKTLGIFRLNKLTPGGQQMPFAEVKHLAEEAVREPLVNERLNEYVAQLRGKAIIDIRL